MADIRIVNGTVVTMDAERRVIEDGVVLITGDRIEAVGTGAELAGVEAGRTIDAGRKLVMPGLVDAHAHAGHGLIKTMGGGDGEVWNDVCEVVYTVGSDEEFWAAEARLAALERLRFGVTTGVSLLGGGDTIMRTDAPDYAAAHCAGVLEVGTRSVVAVGPTRPPHPRRYRRWRHGDGYEDSMVSAEQQLETCEAILTEWHGSHGQRIRIAMLTPTLRAEHEAGLGDADLADAIRQARAARELGRRYGTIFTQDGHTRGSVRFAHERVGILGPDALLSHATDLTAEEIAILAETDTRIAHNPSAIASILGRCPVPELLEAGVTVAIGSDATAPDRSGDMFRHMQQCLHYHRTYFKDPRVLSPGKVWEMSTIDAARALGMEREIGSLEAGKKADVVLLDLARPHLYPPNMPLFRAVYFANGNDVSTVIVDGRVCMEGRNVLTVDETRVLEGAQAATETMLARTGLAGTLETPDHFWGRVRF